MINQVKKHELPLAVKLLQESGLPFNDVTANTDLYVLNEEDKFLALVGLETYENAGLIRSLTVSPALRNKGVGSDMVDFIEREAKRKQIENLYLLTTTASPFFQKKGYQTISREIVPEQIRNSSQFSSICPSTAVLMHKKLL